MHLFMGIGINLAEYSRLYQQQIHRNSYPFLQKQVALFIKGGWSHPEPVASFINQQQGGNHAGKKI